MNKTVLLTDDNPDIIELVQLVLGKSGYRLLTANDGRQAIEICLKENPDLVLMDLNMPHVNGFDATRRLREQGFRSPIIVLTGSESDDDRRKAKDAGCDDYILKTMEMRDVERVVDRFLIGAGDME
ncbi:MAG: response regulator [Gammaproteobacteria bacterium]|nr:response regulator [Gammaproteobacteria bacterium]